MSSPVSFGQVAQLVKKFERVGWNAKQISQLGQAAPELFQRIEIILNGTSDTHLRFQESVTLAPTKGQSSIVEAKDIFPTLYTVSCPLANKVDRFGTRETIIDIYEIKRRGSFCNLFCSLGVDLYSLCLTEGQIVEFVRTNLNLVREKSTHFLFEVNGELAVASFKGVSFHSLHVTRFDVGGVSHLGNVLNMLVVPKQTV